MIMPTEKVGEIMGVSIENDHTVAEAGAAAV